MYWKERNVQQQFYENKQTNKKGINIANYPEFL